MQGVGCRVWGVGCRVWGVGCRVQGVECRQETISSARSASQSSTVAVIGTAFTRSTTSPCSGWRVEGGGLRGWRVESGGFRVQGSRLRVEVMGTVFTRSHLALPPTRPALSSTRERYIQKVKAGERRGACRARYVELALARQPLCLAALQGYLAHKKPPPPLGVP